MFKKMKLKKRIPRQVWVLGLVSLFTDIASEMLYPVTPVFLTSVLGASMAVVGIIEGVAEVTAGFLKGYFGALSDRVRKRSIFVTIGYSLSAIVKPLPGLFPGVGAVIGSRVLDRVGKGIRTAPRDALLAANSDGDSGAVFGFHRGMDTLGAALGPVIALIILYFYPENYTLVFLMAFVPSVPAVIATLYVKDRFIEKNNKNPGNYLTLLKSVPASYKKILLIVVLFSLINSSDVFLILKTDQAAGSGMIAIAGYIFYNLVYASASYPVGLLADKLGKRRIFAFGLLVFAVVYLGFAFTTDTIPLFGLFALYGIYASATEGVVKAWISDVVPDNLRGSAIGLLTMLQSFAVMAGSTLTGLLWDHYGATVPFIISGSVALVLAFVVVIPRTIRS